MARRDVMRDKANPQYGDVKTQRDLGKLVREQRRHLGMTLEEFFESSGISTRLMSELERGKVESVGRLIRVLHMLGLELVVAPRSDTPAIRSTLASRHNDD